MGINFGTLEMHAAKGLREIWLWEAGGGERATLGNNKERDAGEPKNPCMLKIGYRQYRKLPVID